MTSESVIHHVDLVNIVENVSIVSPHEYLIQGFTKAFPNTPVNGSSEYPKGSDFAASLEADLYTRFYCRPITAPRGSADPLASRDHVTALSEANCGTGAWESGWRIVEVRSLDKIAVRKDKVVFWVNRAGLKTASRSLLPGIFCRVRVEKEMRHLSPGFYFAIGNGDPITTKDREGALLRLYWNLRAEAAVKYMASATRLFNESRVPFRTKVLSDPRSYSRADAGVLYVEQRATSRIVPTIRRLYELIKEGLRDDVPMFTKKLAPGLGLAEDPGSGLSFGQSRCTLVAQGLWSIFVKGETGNQRVLRIAHALEEGGVNPTASYLSNSLVDSYACLDISGDRT